MIVRWGLESLPAVLGELGITAPLLISTERWRALEVPVERRFHGALPHAEIAGVRAALGEAASADGLVALGGGSAIDTAKAVSGQTGLPIVSIPTTYSGAEWTQGFGIRDPQRKMRGGGSGALLGGIVYDVGLTVAHPREQTVGTAMNALAHCAEALYAHGRNDEADAVALEGAALIVQWLPEVVDDPLDRDFRTELLRGAALGGEALSLSMLALAHAMAQAVGGKYGLPHGTLNGICLPPALRYNQRYAATAIRRFGEAVGDDPIARVEELAALGGITRLRDLAVPEADLADLGTAAAQRAGNQANPHPATPAEIVELLRSVW